MKQAYLDPTGVCEQCHIPFYGERHNHCPIKTFTPADAMALWLEGDNAPESRE